MLLKRGVRRLDQLPHARTAFGRRRKIDVRLYGELLSGGADAERWLPIVIEYFMVANRDPGRPGPGQGAYKRTHSHRFRELDERLAELVSRAPAGAGAPLRVHDAGASDGRTSVELYRRLSQVRAIDFTASDWYRLVYVVRHARRGWSVAFDEDGKPLQYAGFGFVLSPLEPDPLVPYAVNRALQAVFERWLRPRAARALAQTDRATLGDLDRVRSGDFLVERIPLVCSECLELCRSDRAFRFVRHDVRRPSETPFDLVRVMNVFNHLTREDQREAVRACHASLVDGGLLAIGQSGGPGEPAPTSIFVREGPRLRPHCELEGGVGLAELVRSAFE
jgi:hypothetical protein